MTAAVVGAVASVTAGPAVVGAVGSAAASAGPPRNGEIAVELVSNPCLVVKPQSRAALLRGRVADETDQCGDERVGVALVRPDGSRARRIGGGAWKGLRAPVFSPDGHWVAMPSHKHLVVANTGTTTARSILRTEVFRDPVWSPGSTQIAFRQGGSANSYTIGRDGTDRRTLAALTGWSTVPLAWSSRGTLAMHCSALPDALAPCQGIYLMPRDGGTSRQIPAASSYPVSWSPDGQSLAFTTTEGELRVFDSRTGRVRFVLAGEPAYVLDWFPDGRRVLVAVRTGATDFALKVAAVTESAGRALTVARIGPSRMAARSERWATLSPDGKHVVFIRPTQHKTVWPDSSRTQPEGRLYIASVTGQNLRRILTARHVQRSSTQITGLGALDWGARPSNGSGS